MLKHTLAARVFASKNNPILQGVRFEAAGENRVRAVATNTHILAVVEETVPDVADAPAKAKAGMDFEPFIISADDCQEIETLRHRIARGTRLPVLEFAFINTAKAKDNGSVPVIVTDLEKTVMIRVPKIEGEFPNWKGLVKMAEEPPSFHTAFDPDYLITICQLAKAIGAAQIDMRIFDQQGGVDGGAVPKMVVFDAANEGDGTTAKMLVMPRRVE